jgi:hypothetical protein
MLRQSSTSIERYRVRVESAVDPTATAPQFALIPDTEPDAGDWVAGSWDSAGYSLGAAWALTPTVSGEGEGGGIELPDGVYSMWVKVTGAGGEVPVKRVPTTLEMF